MFIEKLRVLACALPVLVKPKYLHSYDEIELVVLGPTG